MSPISRTALVSPERLAGWVERFAAGHGALQIQDAADGVLLTAGDGASAALTPPWSAAGRPGRGGTAVERLAALAAQNRTAAVVLLRRGGYAIGLCSGGDVLVSKTGSRYVQSRTAAGGWSQQRYARRRANQADALVEAVAEHARRILGPASVSPGLSGATSAEGSAPRAEYLVLGGDRALTQALLAEPRAAFLSALVQLRFLDVPDPKAAVLKQAAQDLRSVRIDITDP